jgi:lipopolysaccharide transport system ATP-binding protein
MSKIAINISSVSKKYDIGKMPSDTLSGSLGKMFSRKESVPFWALDNVSLSINQGEVIGIIGSNGAGKSTLLKILSKITKPTKGIVELNGRVASLLEVGTGFHPELTGRENIFLNGSLLGLSRKEIKERISDIIEFSGIEKFIETPVKKYSSGMYVRLAFSVAAHLNPEILLVDEVLAVGDYDFQQKCLGKMEEVATSGRTVVLVSHNLEVIQNLCSRTIWLDKGKVAFEGNTGDTIAAYLSHLQSDKSIESDSVIKDVNVQQKDTDIHIRVKYDMGNETIVPHLGFVLYDESLRAVLGSNPILENAIMPSASSSGEIVAAIKSPNLKNGNYTISLWFGDGAKDIENLEHCARFSIFNMTSFPNQDSSLGPVAAKCTYSYE